MKTLNVVPSTNDKEHAAQLLMVRIESCRGQIPSYRSYDFKHTHDGVSITPNTSNHFGFDELDVVNGFCIDHDFTWSVFVAPGSKSPSIEINICK